MRHVLNYIKKDLILLLIIVTAFFLYMLIIFPSGTFFCFKNACGINFWGVHGHDAIWHLAIATVSFKSFPFIAPTFAGENLYGYNFLLDFVIFLLSKIGIPPVIAYFKILPVLWFIIFTGLLVTLARKINDSIIFIRLFLFFSYFAGSFSYFLILYHHKTIDGSSSFLPQPIMHMMSNPPYAFSLLPFLYLLIVIKQGKFTNKLAIISGINIFIIMGLKFYGGVISIFMIYCFLLLTGIKEKKINRFIKHISIISLFVVIGVFFFYNPFTSLKTGSIFGFAPLALVHTITEEPNQFYLQSMTDARYFLVEHGIGPRLILIEMINITVFLFFYLGTRFFGLIYLFYLLLRKKMSRFDLTVFTTIIFSCLLTMTLVQKAEWWNTIQFFFYTIFFITIYLTMLTFEMINKKKILYTTICTIIILLSIPTSLDLAKQFFATPGATYVSHKELLALNFLKQQPSGIVLTPLYNKNIKKIDKTNPLYTYEDTAYISAFSGQQSYFANELQLRLTGVSYKKRKDRLEKMDCSVINEVDYIYEIKQTYPEDKIVLKCKPINIKLIFTNDEITIYSVQKNTT